MATAGFANFATGGGMRPTLSCLFILAMQHGMIRAGTGMLPAKAAHQFVAGRIR